MSEPFRLSLRQSYRCPCSGERWDLRPYRLTGPDLETDDAEQALVNCETPTGSRPSTCPHRAFADPYVLEIVRAHGYGKGALSERYGGSPPAYVIDGVEVYGAALNSVQVYDIREDRADREAEAAKRKPPDR